MTRVLVIGLDAAESALLEAWARRGELPVLARLAARGIAFRLQPPWTTLPTGVWPELTSGRSSGKVAFYFAPRQLRTGEATPRPVEPGEVDLSAFWTVASDAGQRVAAIDVPWTVAPSELNGVFLAEWGTHDRWLETRSIPGPLVDEIRARYGEYPVWQCDKYPDSIEERERLLAGLLAGVEQEERLLLDLLGRERWDLFACAFGQYQCVGHNFWGYMDGTLAGDGQGRLRDAILAVYRRIDGAVGALVEAAGRETVVVVVASHGMGPVVGGPHLLPEVLVRLGLGSGAGAAARVRSRLPVGVRKRLRQVVPGSLRRKLQTSAGSLPSPLESPRTRAIALDSDVGGYIRLNIKGREPFGAVEPGAEAAGLVEEIRHELLLLEDPRSGEPVVSGVVTAAEAFGHDHHPDVPDLMVSFRRDLGPLEACRSERVGLVQLPARVALRSGDHTPSSRLWIGGPGIRASAKAGEGRSVDLAPTVLSLLGVPLPPELDGRPLLEP